MDNRPATLDADLRAAELDLDALTTFAKTAVADDGFALPQQGTLALDIGKATFAGVAARTVNAQIKFDAGKLQIDRLSVGDLGGAALDISGRIDELSSQPRGQVTLDLDARALAGLSDIVGKFAPQAAEFVAPFCRSSGAGESARRADRRAGGDGWRRPAAPPSSTSTEVWQPCASLSMARRAANRPISATLSCASSSRLDADDGTALVALLGLDRVLAVDQLPGRMTLSAAGPLNGDLHVDGRVSASGFDAAVQGALRLNGERGRRARCEYRRRPATCGRSGRQ